MPEKNYESKNIKLCADGKYRWVYELNLYRNSAVLRECYRVLFIAAAVIALFMFFLNLDQGLMQAVQFALTAGAVTLGCLGVLGAVAYLILALMYKGKYCVVFEMDEQGILHAQQNEQVKKAQLIGAITAMTGATGGKIGVVGTGLLAATKTKMYSRFSEMKEVEAVPGSNLIRLNAALDRNQVYVDKEDFAFVLDYISQHCPQVKLH